MITIDPEFGKKANEVYPNSLNFELMGELSENVRNISNSV